jgi:hypothetical protein
MVVDKTARDGKGWRPIPLPLKVLSVVMVLWSVGSMINLPNLMENGLPLLGNFVYGLPAFLVALLLDIIGPLVFLLGLWNRKSWAAKWAFTYIGIFIVNSAFALFTVRDQLGLPQILAPAIGSILFLAVIYWKREYFSRAS